jgi:hypothetical protein
MKKTKLILRDRTAVINAKYVLAIDPSINFCGVAIFKKDGTLIKSQLLTPQTKTDDWQIKANIIYEEVRGMKKKLPPDTIQIIEVPEFWGVAGYMARESGAVFKLTFLCGMLYTLHGSISVTPSMWKGQLPKEVIQNRLKKVYPKPDIGKMNHNIVDAIGIGRAFLFELK